MSPVSRYSDPLNQGPGREQRMSLQTRHRFFFYMCRLPRSPFFQYKLWLESLWLSETGNDEEINDLQSHECHEQMTYKATRNSVLQSSHCHPCERGRERPSHWQNLSFPPLGAHTMMSGLPKILISSGSLDCPLLLTSGPIWEWCYLYIYLFLINYICRVLVTS